MSDDVEKHTKDDLPPVMIVNSAGLGAARPPLTLKALAWKILWAFLAFIVIVILSALLITWLWNENLAAVAGLPEIELRTAASAIVIFRLASFIWRM